MNVRVNLNLAAKHLDIISFNRYNGWYANPGRLNMIRDNVVREATEWHEKHKKLVLMSEYGSDTIEGLHMVYALNLTFLLRLVDIFLLFYLQLPAFVWSEEYQVQQFSKHFEAFDILRQKGFFIGEFVWNFADFKTAQSKSSLRVSSLSLPSN
jgi:beta-glucuronidase